MKWWFFEVNIFSDNQIEIESQVALVKDLVTENVDGSAIYFCDAASDNVRQDRNAKIVGTPVVSIKIGDHYYYGLCDMEIKLANREVIYPVGIVRDVEILCGKVNYPTDLLVLGSVEDKFCPIIFGRPFLNTCSAVIDFKKEKVL